MNRRVWIERVYEACSGCRRCEIACSLYHKGRIWPEACARAAEALSVDSQTGAVKVDVSKCTACGLCIKACPGRVPHMHPKKNHIVICDLCNGNPKCVEACQEGKWNALRLIPRKEAFPYKSLVKTPEELTLEVSKRIFGEEIARKIYG